ncbi:MAG: Helix-turn-helix domain protein [Deltaproteobacteria bacterium ADurb.Bin135]|nr:MAG: Helix-turn-helix domain protein [Deltaproteobacteria bacterium ADurb.Bin135]
MKLLTVKELANILKSKPSTIYAWVEQGIVPYVKLNGLVRFDESDIYAWINTAKGSCNKVQVTTKSKKR